MSRFINHLRIAEARFIRNCDAASYPEMVKEMRASPLFEDLRYVQLQKKAAKFWAAAKDYRAEQREARTPVGPVAAARYQFLRW